MQRVSGAGRCWWFCLLISLTGKRELSGFPPCSSAPSCNLGSVAPRWGMPRPVAPFSAGAWVWGVPAPRTDTQANFQWGFQGRKRSSARRGSECRTGVSRGGWTKTPDGSNPAACRVPRKSLGTLLRCHQTGWEPKMPGLPCSQAGPTQGRVTRHLTRVCASRLSSGQTCL